LLLFCQCKSWYIHRKVSQRCKDIPAQVSIPGNESKERKKIVLLKKEKNIIDWMSVQCDVWLKS